jgi:hypothetical protein
MEAARILRLKIVIVTKLQTRYRMGKDKAFVHSVRQDFATRRCQKHLRGFLDRKKAKQARDMKCMVISIQIFYKRRFKLKRRSAIILQKLLKGLKSYKKVKKLKTISAGSTVLLSTVRNLWKKKALKTLLKHAKAIRV